MPRNLDRRVEVLFPLESQELIEHIKEEILGTYLGDNVKARQMHGDGSYTRRTPGKGKKAFNSQSMLLDKLKAAGR